VPTLSKETVNFFSGTQKVQRHLSCFAILSVATLVSQLLIGAHEAPFFPREALQGDEPVVKLTISYDNGINKFTHHVDAVDATNAMVEEIFDMAINTIFPRALFVPDMEPKEEQEETIESHPEVVRQRLYEEVDDIINDMYGYYNG